MVSAAQLAEFPPFSRLTPEHQSLIAATAARDVALGPGARLFGEGDPAEGCWLIRGGQVAVGTQVPGRGLVVVQTLGRGDVLGWSWLVPPHRWRLSARAVEDVRAVQFDGECLRGKCEEDTALGYALLSRFAGDLADLLTNSYIQLLDVYGNGGR